MSKQQSNWGEPGLQYPNDLAAESEPVQKAVRMIVDNLHFLRGQTGTTKAVGAVANAGPSNKTAGSSETIVANIQATQQPAVIPATQIDGTSGGTTYRVNYYLETTKNDGAAGTITARFTFTDGAGAVTVNSAALGLNALGRTSGVFFVHTATGAISYQTVLGGGFATAQYGLYICVERLS